VPDGIRSTAPGEARAKRRSAALRRCVERAAALTSRLRAESGPAGHASRGSPGVGPGPASPRDAAVSPRRSAGAGYRCCWQRPGRCAAPLRFRGGKRGQNSAARGIEAGQQPRWTSKAPRSHLSTRLQGDDPAPSQKTPNRTQKPGGRVPPGRVPPHDSDDGRLPAERPPAAGPTTPRPLPSPSRASPSRSDTRARKPHRCGGSAPSQHRGWDARPRR